MTHENPQKGLFFLSLTEKKENSQEEATKGGFRGKEHPSLLL